jgi:ABC-type branched-subunit amino acid transport system ATPase component
MLLMVLDRLVEKGNTVILIEHNMHVIKMADYIIDMGGGTAMAWSPHLQCGNQSESFSLLSTDK